ncbi:hypothetical protein [Actinoplanes sp. NPDC051851]|uniref:hypothetical protein n=1 Tax=Actinoplanes sp. NPDC051851 TaxID=3154753 RepID=UPI00341E1269
MRIPFARTSAETNLFMELNPCSCGNGAFPGRQLPWGISVLEVSRQLTVRYDWDCPGCGTHREFDFRTPKDPEPFPRPGEQFRWGDGTTPSELLDPGEWMLVADRYAGSVRLTDPDRRVHCAMAAAAVDEVLLFVKRRLVGAHAVPRSAFWTPVGKARYEEMPFLFERPMLEVTRDTYRNLANEP